MKYFGLCLVVLVGLVGCDKQSTSAIEEPASPIAALSWLEHADVETDIANALSENDMRLWTIAGRGMKIPGLTDEQITLAQTQCQTRMMPGMGDVIADPEHKKWWNKGRDYAKEYNQRMVAYCLK